MRALVREWTPRVRSWLRSDEGRVEDAVEEVEDGMAPVGLRVVAGRQIDVGRLPLGIAEEVPREGRCGDRVGDDPPLLRPDRVSGNDKWKEIDEERPDRRTHGNPRGRG